MAATWLVKTRSTRVRAPVPANDSRPMWLMSNRPAAVRTALCSSAMPVYWMGMSQPPNSTRRAPWARCRSYRGVRKAMALPLGARAGAQPRALAVKAAEDFLRRPGREGPRGRLRGGKSKWSPTYGQDGLDAPLFKVPADFVRDRSRVCCRTRRLGRAQLADPLKERSSPTPF